MYVCYPVFIVMPSSRVYGDTGDGVGTPTQSRLHNIRVCVMYACKRVDDRRLNTYLTHVNIIIYFFFIVLPPPPRPPVLRASFGPRRRSFACAQLSKQKRPRRSRNDVPHTNIRARTDGGDYGARFAAFTINQRNIVPSLFVSRVCALPGGIRIFFRD